MIWYICLNVSCNCYVSEVCQTCYVQNLYTVADLKATPTPLGRSTDSSVRLESLTPLNEGTNLTRQLASHVWDLEILREFRESFIWLLQRYGWRAHLFFFSYNQVLNIPRIKRRKGKILYLIKSWVRDYCQPTELKCWKRNQQNRTNAEFTVILFTWSRFAAVISSINTCADETFLNDF